MGKGRAGEFLDGIFVTLLFYQNGRLGKKKFQGCEAEPKPKFFVGIAGKCQLKVNQIK